VKCQAEGCQEQAVSHITDVVGEEFQECHLCEAHMGEYLDQAGHLREQLREACAASGTG